MLIDREGRSPIALIGLGEAGTRISLRASLTLGLDRFVIADSRAETKDELLIRFERNEEGSKDFSDMASERFIQMCGDMTRLRGARYLGMGGLWKRGYMSFTDQDWEDLQSSLVENVYASAEKSPSPEPGCMIMCLGLSGGTGAGSSIRLAEQLRAQLLSPRSSDSEVVKEAPMYEGPVFALGILPGRPGRTPLTSARMELNAVCVLATLMAPRLGGHLIDGLILVSNEYLGSQLQVESVGVDEYDQMNRLVFGILAGIQEGSWRIDYRDLSSKIVRRGWSWPSIIVPASASGMDEDVKGVLSEALSDKLMARCIPASATECYAYLLHRGRVSPVTEMDFRTAFLELRKSEGPGAPPIPTKVAITGDCERYLNEGDEWAILLLLADPVLMDLTEAVPRIVDLISRNDIRDTLYEAGVSPFELNLIGLVLQEYLEGCLGRLDESGRMQVSRRCDKLKQWFGSVDGDADRYPDDSTLHEQWETSTEDWIREALKYFETSDQEEKRGYSIWP